MFLVTFLFLNYYDKEEIARLLFCFKIKYIKLTAYGRFCFKLWSSNLFGYLLYKLIKLIKYLFSKTFITIGQILLNKFD